MLMRRANPLTVAAVRLARIPLRLTIRPVDFVPPRKALILKPCCLSQVMLATPLLEVLHRAYPEAQFDWAVSDWARPAILSNPRISRLVRTGQVGLPNATWRDVLAFVAELREQNYDTCFIPSGSSLLSLIPWLAGIPQRIGLDINGRGLAHTTAVSPHTTDQHTADLYLELASALGLDGHTAVSQFFPTDQQRADITARLVDEVGWLGEVPLVIIHPGGGVNPVRPDLKRRWPPERLARLATHLIRRYQVRVLLVSSQFEAELVHKLVGMIPADVTNWAGQVSLGELGALGEIASLYVGHDAGASHVVAAVGCPTLVIFGPSNPRLTAPLGSFVHSLWRKPDATLLDSTPFSWEDGVSTAEAIDAAEAILTKSGWASAAS